MDSRQASELGEDRIGGTRSFLPAVEGLRACAAMGVVITHVAFQTGQHSGVSGRLLSRFDMAVAVFFALSGFLLWRGHAAAAQGLRERPPTTHYLRSRIVRIMPGYLMAVVVILFLGRRFAGLGAGMVDQGALGWADWLLLALVPVAAVVLATVTARLTVMHTLRKML